MTKRHFTKKALLMSILSLVLCISMLVGTTFAWFTDSVTSSGNIIKSGKLEVGMYWADGTQAVPTAKEGWTDASKGAIFNYDNWEPGYVEVRHIKIANEGTLALKYKVNIVANGEVSDLADVIDVYYVDPALQIADRSELTEGKKLGTLTEVLAALGQTGNGTLKAGQVDTITIALKMQETAGNEYQEKSIGTDFSIQLVATQLTYEGDDFDNQFDKDALFPGTSNNQTLGADDVILTTEGENKSVVKLNGELVNDLLGDDVTDVMLDVSLPEITEDDEGNVSVLFSKFEVVDQDGKAISLEDSPIAIPVKLFVGEEYANKYATIKHDGVLIATGLIDADGYISYNTTHFCTITLDITEEAPKLQISDLKVEAVSDPTTLVTVLVGNHYYTVSQGMINSWKTLSNKEQIVADIYCPEDLIAYAMMHNNGDITMDSGVHTDLTIKNDLNFAGYNWIPIGRFFTNIHGEGKTISNLNNSFFGCVYDCHIDDLTLMNVNASGSLSGVVAKQLAGDVFISNLTIAGTNTVTYVKDNAVNWPEEGTGVGAICGLSLIAYSGNGRVDITVTGTIDVYYNDVVYGNNTNLENLTFTPELGLNVYKPNQNVTIVLDNGAINVHGRGYKVAPLYVNSAADLLNAIENQTIIMMSDITLEEEFVVPAGVTIVGNGYHINGTVYAGGDLTFEGHVKIAAFSASYYDRVITILEGACLEITGGGRVSVAYGNVFNIYGTIANAKEADKTTLQPSLIIPAGISITGGSDATMNVINAYVKVGSTTSKNSAADGTFTFNFENSIVEFTKDFAFAEPTNNKAPTFKMNIKDSVVTTGTKFTLCAPDTTVVLDNSTLTASTYFRNSGELTLKNGSTLTASTIQFGENGGNNGTTIVDNTTLSITASSTGHALDGKGTGSIVVKNGGNASVTYYKGITVDCDDLSTFTGTEVK